MRRRIATRRGPAPGGSRLSRNAQSSRGFAQCSAQQSSSSSTDNETRPPAIFSMRNATVFPFGVPSNDLAYALLTKMNWTIADDECWAILSSSSSCTKSGLLDTVLAQARFHPPQSVSHPILATLPPRPRPAKDGGPRAPIVSDIIQLVSFKTRLAHTGGGFDDYTARYYSIRDEDKLTTRQHLTRSRDRAVGSSNDEIITKMAKVLEVDDLLDLPLVTLSNGQTRRTRILRALLASPQLLVLEEPFTGLDVASRGILTSLLSSLHRSRTPRVLLVLRPQDELPEFITHIALVGNEKNEIEFGTRDVVLSGEKAKVLVAAGVKQRERSQKQKDLRRERATAKPSGRPLVELKGVNVAYQDRKVLQNINWTIREGERWILSGHNGSGKSTLLSIVLGDHPRSFTENVVLFGQPRDKQATATLQGNIGHVSPEIFNAFPRKFGDAGLTAKEAIVTGFESIYSYRKITSSQEEQLAALLTELGHPELTPALLGKLFAELTPGQQSLILLIRALVKRPSLLVLDEPFAFMDQLTVDLVKAFIDEKLQPSQAVIIITHFEEELPDTVGRTLKLEHGRIVENI